MDVEEHLLVQIIYEDTKKDTILLKTFYVPSVRKVSNVKSMQLDTSVIVIWTTANSEW